MRQKTPPIYAPDVLLADLRILLVNAGPQVEQVATDALFGLNRKLGKRIHSEIDGQERSEPVLEISTIK